MHHLLLDIVYCGINIGSKASFPMHP
jgi:hypothetical protein